MGERTQGRGTLVNSVVQTFSGAPGYNSVILVKLLNFSLLNFRNVL